MIIQQISNEPKPSLSPFFVNRVLTLAARQSEPALKIWPLRLYWILAVLLLSLLTGISGLRLLLIAAAGAFIWLDRAGQRRCLRLFGV
jgi:hypothetical protein